jgi:L-ascorbate metabolism protein UlaG (beta-lactamase superfamily)
MLTEMLNNIFWRGHDGFMIKADDKIVSIDPYQVALVEPADILLTTHVHYDHCLPEDIEKLRTDSTVIVTEPESDRQLSGDIRIMKPGDAIDVNGVTIEAAAA